jgi:glycine/D-amino acid oxidase-like deaminating enzyme/nitrite reductase/ring-hydroxylating ferredoxin subunit
MAAGETPLRGGGAGEAGALVGRPVAYWIDSTPGTDYPPLRRELDVDVCVVGGGIAGITTAYLLTQAGATVAVVEAGRIVRGVTGHTTAKITSLHDLIYARLIERAGRERAQRYADAQQAAIARIASLVEQLSIDCDFRRTEAYTYTEAEEGLREIHAEVDAARSLGLPASFTDRTPLPYPVRGAVRFAEQAEFHPRKYLLALAEAVVRAGGHVFEQTRAVGFEDGGDGEPCRIETTGGAVRARDAVLATHVPVHDPALYFARLFPKRSYVLGCRLAGPAPRGVFIGTDPGHHTVRSTPLAGPGAGAGQEHELVLLGGEDHKPGEGGDTRERFRTLERWARERFDVRAVDYRWATQDPDTPHGVPFIGRLAPTSRHLWVATGFGGWGMTNATVAAMLLTDLLTGRDTPWAALFDPGRFEAESLGPVARENVGAARHLIGDRFRVEAKDSLQDVALAPGEGAVVRLRGQPVAVSRDARGTLHAVSAVCRHMGCYVAWNAAEETWDCPCHGSRYTADGTVVEGPANESLPPAALPDAGP